MTRERVISRLSTALCFLPMFATCGWLLSLIATILTPWGFLAGWAIVAYGGAQILRATRAEARVESREARVRIWQARDRAAAGLPSPGDVALVEDGGALTLLQDGEVDLHETSETT